ncbi:hypothetical protein ACQ4M3_32715 [Leptolyngbya sp. AN03gr2]|uniref:hypothetical protein n=1 Tax=unclassified Leptolyngbya TaxID=2650499 RepID=UPI003D3108D2
MLGNKAYIVLAREVRNTYLVKFPNLGDFLNDRISVSWFGGVHIITRGKPE